MGVAILPSGITLAVEEFGEQVGGVPLVVLHGGPSWSHHYLNPGLRLFGERRHVIAPDLRGCGGSSRDLPLSEYQPELAVQDVVDLITVMGLTSSTCWGSPPAASGLSS